jgi:lysophospholipase L1-like esterase
MRYWIAVLAMLLPAVALAAPNCPSAASVAAEPRPNPAMYESPTPGSWTDSKVLVVGDSIAARWMPALDTPTYNFGHGGDRTQWVLWRLQHADLNGAHFESAVVIAGTNNSGPRYSACEIATGVVAIVDLLKTKFSIKNVVVISLLPRGRNLSQNEATIEQTNQILAASADEVGYRYVDLNARFRQGCGQNNSCDLYLPGLIHPSASGYRIFDDTIKQAVH